MSVLCVFLFLIRREPQRSTRPDTLFPYTTLVLSRRASRSWRPPPASRRWSGPCHHTRGASTWHPQAGRSTACNCRKAASPSGSAAPSRPRRSEEHTSELQSLLRISYAVFCLKNNTMTITSLVSPDHYIYYTT